MHTTQHNSETLVTLNIEGMHCASCVARLEKALGSTDGVREASVNFGTETATIRFDPAIVQEAGLIDMVEKTGYKASISKKAEAGLEERQRAQIKRWRNRLIFGIVFTVPIMVLSMLVPEFAGRYTILFALGTAVQLYLGLPYYKSAANAARRFTANMDTLIALGSSAAYLYSIAVSFILPGEGYSVYYEGAAMILTLITLGKWLEAGARFRTSQAVRKLMELAPKRATVIRDGKETEINAAELVVGDLIVVRPGEKAPVDGIVKEGASAFDESLITGESVPVNKEQGDEVIGGTINKEGMLTFEATKVGEETALNQIIAMVRSAQESKADVQRLADRVAGVFVPAVMGIAMLTFVGWMVFGGAQLRFQNALLSTVAVLIIACPCALGLATPTAIMVGSGLGAANGILIKEAHALEQTGKLDVVILDKTGTLTRGRPEVTEIKTAAGWEGDAPRLLALAASAEYGSEHPLGKAIVEEAGKEGLDLSKSSDFLAVPGQGVSAEVGSAHVLVGTARLMDDNGVEYAAEESEIERLEQEGNTVVIVAEAGRVAGLVALADRPKDHAKEAVAALKELGLEVVMVTGDNERTARAIALETGIDGVFAEVPPDKKADRVKELQDQGKLTAMVGDGINDAPALAQADVGMAIGTGADVAMETADITLVGGDVRGVADAVRLSRRTMRTIKQNLFLAFVYNSAAIPIAAAGLLNPMIAAGAMAASSVSVVSNSLLLKRRFAGLKRSSPAPACRRDRHGADRGVRRV